MSSWVHPVPKLYQLSRRSVTRCDNTQYPDQLGARAKNLPAVRKITYTTNAIESLNRVIRETTKTRGSFPTDDAATNLIYLAIRNFGKQGGASENGLLPETNPLVLTRNGSK